MKDIKCCLIEHPEFDGCCCICKWLLPLHSHPDVDGQNFSNQLGFVCLGPFAGNERVVFITTQHGMCEMFFKQQ